MNLAIRSCLPLTVVFILSAKDAEPGLKITIHVYDYAKTSAEVLNRAEREAARIYERTGLATEWVDCPLSPDEAAQFPACQLPTGPAIFALRILSRPMAERLRLGQGTYGLALLPDDGGFGFAASILSHRAEELAKGRESLYAVILGHLMAHELGHLLLGAGSHSASGLMHVPWRGKELEHVTQGSLLFTSWQVETIRNHARDRMSASQAALRRGGGR